MSGTRREHLIQRWGDYRFDTLILSLRAGPGGPIVTRTRRPPQVELKSANGSWRVLEGKEAREAIGAAKRRGVL